MNIKARTKTKAHECQRDRDSDYLTIIKEVSTNDDKGERNFIKPRNRVTIRKWKESIVILI